MSYSTSRSRRTTVKQHGDAIVITYSVLTCRGCPLQKQFTTSKTGRRMLTLRPEELHENLARAHAEQKTGTWKNKYAPRAGVEDTINTPETSFTTHHRCPTGGSLKAAGVTQSDHQRQTAGTFCS
ncbi:transposase [Streptomyces sp. NPDC048527]|uniref:transposase n=1 Tax=Streptomyces sp. NPDC048527 TaxID=3365568 RepID=UPI00371AC693